MPASMGLWLRRVGGAAALVAVAGGSGPAQAAHTPGSAPPRPAVRTTATGTISTVAGGPGGPARATTVSLVNEFEGLCGVAFGGGALYVGDIHAIRKISPLTDRLTTPAGTGVATGAVGNGIPAASAYVQDPCGAAVDAGNNLVIPDVAQVRVVAARTGTFYGQAMIAGDIYTVAGTGRSGFSGDGGPATSAELGYANVVAVDRRGDLLIGDQANGRVRLVAARTGTFYGRAMIAGDIYTIAGDVQSGFFGDGGPATKAELGFPDGIAVDGAGNLVIADTDNMRVRVVAATTGTFYGRAMTAGDIYTVAGDGQQGFSGDGGPATSAQLDGPQGVAVDGPGNLVIADTGNSRIRVVAAATGTFYGRPMTAGDIYTVATSAFPTAAAVDGSGNLVICGDTQVYALAARTGTFYGLSMTAGHLYRIAGTTGPPGFAGDGGPATAAQLAQPAGVAADGAGDLMIVDEGNVRVRMVPARTGTFFGHTMAAGHIYTIAGDGTAGFAGDGGPATAARLNQLQDVTVDGSGNLVIADSGNWRVRVVAASTGTFYGQTMIAGDIYTVAGDGQFTFSGDSGPAIKAGVGPIAVAVDRVGNLVIADGGGDRIRVVAARTGTFYGQPMKAGDIYTVAGDGQIGLSGDGGPATKAEFKSPDGVAVDAAGNLVIADESRVRVVAVRTGTFYGQPMIAGDIYSVAGTGTRGFSGDGGPAVDAEFSVILGVAVDGAGNLVVDDARNNRIRVVAASTGTFYGLPMTTGDVYTVAGDGAAGFTGDGGAATAAELNEPLGVAVTGPGKLVIADEFNERVRMVTG